MVERQSIIVDALIDRVLKAEADAEQCKRLFKNGEYPFMWHRDQVNALHEAMKDIGFAYGSKGEGVEGVANPTPQQVASDVLTRIECAMRRAQDKTNNKYGKTGDYRASGEWMHEDAK